MKRLILSKDPKEMKKTPSPLLPWRSGLRKAFQVEERASAKPRGGRVLGMFENSKAFIRSQMESPWRVSRRFCLVPTISLWLLDAEETENTAWARVGRPGRRPAKSQERNGGDLGHCDGNGTVNSGQTWAGGSTGFALGHKWRRRKKAKAQECPKVLM